MKVRVSIFLFLLVNLAIAQDSLVYYSDLSFHSTLEKNSFENPEKSVFQLLLTTDPRVDMDFVSENSAKFKKCLDAINDERIDRKENDKKIKIIYNNLHKAYLKVYQRENLFSTTIFYGYYNCVSATALYGIVFKELEIPFILKEKPGHVYMIAYPESDKIIMETTDPTGNFQTYNEEYKAAMVERLVISKLISEDQLKTRSVDEIFNDYYFTDEPINLVQLAGLQYVNHAFYLLERNDLIGALKQVEKAYYLNPAKNIASLILVIIGQLLDEIDYQKIESIDYLEKYSRYDTFNITHEHVLAEFELMTQRQLTENRDSISYRKYYEHFISANRDEILENKISHLFYLRKGLALFNSGHYRKALPDIEKAYKLQSQSLEVSNAFVSVIAQYLASESNHSKAVDKLEIYLIKYPALEKNDNFKSLLIGSYLKEFGLCFDRGDEKRGLKFKADFEKNYGAGLDLPQENIGRAYSLAAVYYFKRGAKSKALNMINEGLKFAPANSELLMRKQIIE